MGNETSIAARTAVTSDFKEGVNSCLCGGISHLHADGELFDVTVTIGEDTFSCHRLVLAAISKYFETFFRNQPRKEFVAINKKSVSSHAFSLLLDMLYKKNDHVKDTETAIELMKAAIFLQIVFLQNHCENFLRKALTPEECLITWQFAVQYDLKNLSTDAKKIAVSHFEEVKEDASFLSLPVSFLLALVSSEDIKVASEDTLCAALLSWIDHSSEERTKHLPTILPFINFTILSEKYLDRLRQEHGHLKALEGYVAEAFKVQLESAKRLNSLAKSEILARQEKRVRNAKAMLVIVGGVDETGKSVQDTKAFPLSEADRNGENTPEPLSETKLSSDAVRCFSSMPECLGTDFAACVWRNELYVSGGSEVPEQFIMYNSGVNKWTKLRGLPQGLAKHAMAATGGNIYLLGGEKQKSEKKPKPSGLVHAYDTEKKVWTKCGELPVPVYDVTAAVLGHRIYVFGGKDADDNPTSLVQCVDTVTGSVSQVGRLPAPTSGARALSDGGTIFLVRAEGDILTMREKTHHKDECKQKERENAESAYGSTAGLSDTTEDTTPYQEDTTHTQRNTSNSTSDPITTTETDTKPTIEFQNFATIAGRSHFGAAIHRQQLVVCGGQDGTGANVRGLLIVDLHTGLVSERNEHVTSTERATSHFSMHSMLLPNITDKVRFRHTFPLKSLTEDRLYSHRVIINNFEWYIGLDEERKNEEGFLAVYLFKAWERPQRKWKVSTKFSFWLLPHQQGAQGVCHECTYIFRDSENLGSGFSKMISLTDLKDPANGYVSEEGEVTIQVEITITAPPELEGEEEEE